MALVETKFLLPDTDHFDQVLRSLEAFGYSVTKGQTETLIDRYFDTPEQSILRAGWSYRCREHAGTRLLTLEAVGATRGPDFVRDQIDQDAPEGSIALENLPGGPVQKRLGRIINGSVCNELFRVENRRTVYALDAPGDRATRYRLGLVRAHVRADHALEDAIGSLDFSELELELEAGEAADVERLADLLSAQEGLVPAQLSKFERGMQVAGLPLPDEHPSLPKGKLLVDDPILALVYHHLEQQLRALELQQPRAWEGLDPEGVHQMRVAIRRTRSVLRSFRDMLHGKTVAHLNTELRWLAKRLGEVRDADVYWEAFHRFRLSLSEPDANALAAYEQHLKDRTAEARGALIEGLASDRYTELVDELERFVEVGPSTSVLRRFGSVRISDGANLYVRPAVSRMLKRGNTIGVDSPARKLHKLRIEGKRLRYLLEFLGEVEAERWTKPLKASRRLQDVLGEHQDAYTARQRLEGYARTVALRKGARESLLALGRLLQREEDRMGESRRRLPKAWARFEKGVSRV